jgi:hypothetical protein
MAISSYPLSCRTPACSIAQVLSSSIADFLSACGQAIRRFALLVKKISSLLRDHTAAGRLCARSQCMRLDSCDEGMALKQNTLSGELNMNATNNTCFFTGRITKDPTESIQNLPNGGTKLSIGVAVKSQAFDKDGEAYERTDYPQLAIWGDLAEQAAIELQKGMLVEVQAQLQTRRWKAEDGSYRYATEFLVTAIRPKIKTAAA